MPLTRGQIAALKTIVRLRRALDAAEKFVGRMPTDKAGMVFITSGGEVVQPDPDQLSDYAAHAGQRRGHWPSSPEIAAAMMKHYQQG
jgi:hypothetical protein